MVGSLHPPESDEATLEAPEVDDDLYHSRGDEVSASRPFLTGDVIDGVTIPGFGENAGPVIVLSHPCNMRKNGVELADRLYVARVAPFQYLPPRRWSSDCLRHLPLPALRRDEHFAAFLSDVGMADAGQIQEGERIACLSDFGVNLLQQRLIFCLTRFVVPIFKLRASCTAVFVEVDLHEEWAESREATADAVAEEFHTWIRERDEANRMRQERLKDPGQVAAVRREMRRRLRAESDDGLT